MVKLLPCAINSEAGIVFSLFLIFGDFEPRCSYKIKECIHFFDVFQRKPNHPFPMRRGVDHSSLRFNSLGSKLTKKSQSSTKVLAPQIGFRKG